MSLDLASIILCVIIAINQFVIRSKVWQKHMWLFWGPQILNIFLGSYSLLFGIPGVPPALDVINWLIGCLFIFHFLQNQRRFFRYVQIQKEENRTSQN